MHSVDGRNVEERKINLIYMHLNSEDAQIKKLWDQRDIKNILM